MTDNSKKETWRWVLNLIVSVLTALAAALGTNSCVQYQMVSPDTETVTASAPALHAENAVLEAKECSKEFLYCQILHNIVK